MPNDCGRARSGEVLTQLISRANLELVVDVSQVVFDRFRADKELGGGLARGVSLSEGERDLQLLGRQIVAGRQICGGF